MKKNNIGSGFVRISKKQLIDEKRIGLFIRGANIALKKSGVGNIKFREIDKDLKEYFSFDIIEVEDTQKHLE